MRDLPALLDQLEQAEGPPDPVPSADGWELVLAENVAYLVDDQRPGPAPAPVRRTGHRRAGYAAFSSVWHRSSAVFAGW
jgi:hypothetical protein